MRLHRNLVLAVIESLSQIFNQNKQADKIVAITLKQDKRWGARDRSFVAETIYEIVRWKRLYAKLAEIETAFDNDIYSTQNLFQLFSVWAILNEIELPTWEEFEAINQSKIDEIKQNYTQLQEIRKYKESIPDWLDNLGEKELGDEIWTKEIAALNNQAPVVLRVNTLKISVEKLQKQLSEQNIETEKITQKAETYSEAIQLVKRKSIVRNALYKDGFFEIQDASSQLIAHFLDLEKGMQIIDTCAGAGGKSLHIASLLQNKGQITAMDIYENKLIELRKRANRADVHNIKTYSIKRENSSGTNEVNYNQFEQFYNSADRVLIDAPCSGLGVLSRNPDAKWKLNLEFLEEIKQTQQTLLQEYSKMTKKGGKLVYATCSILPSENQKQVETFLNSENGKDFKLIEDKKILSHQTGYDGFYMAILKRI